MPRGLNHVGAIGLGGKIYCIGGFIEQNRNAAPDVSAYDPATTRGKSSRRCPKHSALSQSLSSTETFMRSEAATRKV